MSEPGSVERLTDKEKTEFVLGVYFRTQAAIEKYLGAEGLPAWTEHVALINANATKQRLPEPADQARSLLDSLATMLQVYGSDLTLSEGDDGSELDVRRCGIWDFRERAQQQGVELTLKAPCEFCVDLHHRTAAHLGVPVSNTLGHRSCHWETRVPISADEMESG